MQSAIQYVIAAVVPFLVILFGFMWKRISQNEIRIHRIEEIVSEFSNSVQHRLTGVETDLKWIKKAQEGQSAVLGRIEDCVRKERN